MININYYNDIKTLLINNEVTKKVKDYSKNRSDLTTYYNVGKLLSEAGKHYGEGIIKEYSRKLTSELKKGYDITNLKRMRQFYCLIEKGAPVAHQLSWSHYKILLPLKDINKINYYIEQIKIRNLSKRELQEAVKFNEYERLPSKAKNKLINKENTKVTDLVKNPILIKNNSYKNISEKILQKLILEDISSFLKQLGNGFTFIDNEYKIKIGDNYNYIDLLLFNYIYNCFIVVELKIEDCTNENVVDGKIKVKRIS